MNLYVALSIHAVLIMAQFLVIPFTPQLTNGQHEAIAACIGTLQTILGTYQHMTGQVSVAEPTPPSPPPPQPK